MSLSDNVRRAKELARTADPSPRSTVGGGVRSLPCVHLGSPTGDTTPCGTCRGTVVNKRFGCGVLGSCVLTDCRTCTSYSRPAPVWTDPTAPFRLDEHNLYPGLPGKRFNPGLIAWGSGYVLCWRDGWKGSNLWCCRLDARFTPVGPATRLDISHPRANYGREDPNLFVHDDALHVAFVGVEGRGTRVVRTNVLYARLGDGFRVEAVYAPVAPGIDPNRWEKNWQWFSHDGTLYAVYSVTPHRVLRVDGGRATWTHETPTRNPWAGGDIRGGATPVLVGDEFHCFFHDKVQRGKLHYRVGCYTFEARPPFRVTRITPTPILEADPRTNPGNYCDCLFPRGAVRVGDDWVLSSGVHDRFTELRRVPVTAVDRAMVPVAPPPGFHYRPGTGDEDIYLSVAGHDEYGLSALDLAGAAVLDVGGHIGCAGVAALDRGAAVVHSYEPYPPSYDLLARNAASRSGWTAFPTAVGFELGSGRFPPPEEVYNTGGWSVLLGDGPATVEPLDAMILRLASASPTGRVNLLKIDCEGGEWPAFSAATRLDLVDRIVGEWHDYEWNGRRWTRDDLHELLPGFVVTVHPPTPPATWGLFHAHRPLVSSKAPVPTTVWPHGGPPPPRTVPPSDPP